MGRDGRLALAFERRGARTVLVGRRYTLPLQALEPVDLDGSGGLALLLLNPTGGILGGDALDTAVRLGPGARVVLSTPSATRVYRTAGPAARASFRAELGAGAVLEYVPDHLIPSPGARLCQRTALRLGSGALALVLDAWSTGRPARGERLAFAELDLGLRVDDDGGPIFAERLRLGGEPRWNALAGLDGHDYVASFVVAGSGERDWRLLLDALRDALDALPGPAEGLAAGATRLARGGLLVRILARSAPLLQAAWETAWHVSRRELLGRPPLALRKL